MRRFVMIIFSCFVSILAFCQETRWAEEKKGAWCFESHLSEMACHIGNTFWNASHAEDDMVAKGKSACPDYPRLCANQLNWGQVFNMIRKN